MAKSLVQDGHVVNGFSPRDLAGQDNFGDWISLKGFNHCSVIVTTAADSGGADPVISLRQAQSATGTGAKALNFTDVWEASDTLLVFDPSFTHHEVAEGNSFQGTGSGENETITIFEVDASSLDSTNGFVWLQVKVDDVVSGPQLGSTIYILSEPRHTRTFNPTV